MVIIISFPFHISPAQCYLPNKSYNKGENLHYNVYYNLGFLKIKLADVKIWTGETTYHNKKVLAVYNTTKTLKEYEWIIKVNDYYVSYLDPMSMKVERHIQKTLVNNYSTNYEYRFDHQNKKVYATIENSKTKKYTDTLTLQPCLHDLLSASYYPRNISFSRLSKGSKISLPVILDTTIRQIYFKYLGIEQINTKNRKNVSCIKFVPLLVETSIFKEGEKMTVWLSNDQNKVPLMMESDLRIGKILVQLVKYEGLRYFAKY
jgi:hypothetical protein